ESLRPKAEGALRRAPARGVQRYERIQQEWNVIARDVEVTLVYISNVGQGIEVFDLRTIGIVHDTSILPVGDAENLIERLTLRELYDRVVELFSANKVDGSTFVQCFVRRCGNWRPYEGDLQFGVRRLHRLGESLVSGPAGSTGKENQELIILADLDGFFGGYVVRRGVGQTRTFQPACRRSQPNRITGEMHSLR